MSDDNPSNPYASVTTSRGFVRDAIAAVQKYIPDSTTALGEMYNSLAFLELSLGENFCNGIPLGSTVNGIPTYGPGLTTSRCSIALSPIWTLRCRSTAKTSAQARVHSRAVPDHQSARPRR